MPNTKKRGGGAGNGPGGGARAPAAVLTAEDDSLATIESKRLYDKLVDDISESNPIIQEDLINYLLNTYNTQRIGLQSVVLPGLQMFLDDYVIGNEALIGTSQFCRDLFGFKSTEFRELLTRNSGNVTQCGKGGYIRNLPMVCIWCGEPIFDMAECEHSLPITPCAGLLGFSSNPERPKIEHILEYGYAHRLCNQVKLDVSFLTWSDTDTKWGINWKNMSAVYNKISRSGPRYKNAQLLAYYLDKKTNKLINTLGTDIPIKNDAVGAPNDERKGNYLLSNPKDIRNRNNLTEGGEHRNKDEIKIACKELAEITTNLSLEKYILAGGAKQKKSKKKQRGGVRKTATTATIATTAETTECKLSNIDTLLSNEGALKKYLSQDLRTLDGAKWLKEPRFYGPYRMKLIEEYCNRYTKLLGPPGNPGNLKYTVLARIVTSPRTEDLAKGFSGAFPANPAKEANDAYDILQLVLKKRIRNFNTYNFNIGSIINLRARAQAKSARKEIPALEYLKQEKLRQFDEIQQLIDDYNTKHSAHYSQINLGDTLDDGTEIPTDSTSIIGAIETHITTLAGLRGGGKIKKMKGGLREAFYSGPEIDGLVKFVLSHEIETPPELDSAELFEPFTYFYSKEPESLEDYNQTNIDITKRITELVNAKEAEDTAILQSNQVDKVIELIEKLINIEDFLPELGTNNPDGIGITDNQKYVIFAAIIFTNVSIGIEYSNVNLLINYLYNLFFTKVINEGILELQKSLTDELAILKSFHKEETTEGNLVFPNPKNNPEGYATPKFPGKSPSSRESRESIKRRLKDVFTSGYGGYPKTQGSGSSPRTKRFGGSRKKITINRKNTKKLNKRKN